MALVDQASVVGIQFSIPSPETIRRCSVVEVERGDTYVNGKPVAQGLFDFRMGTLEPGTYCPTDGLNHIDCPGYFGHIELARPVFWATYYSTIVDILKVVCFRCSKLLVDKVKHRAWLDLPNDKRWKRVYGMAPKLKRCGEHNDDGCGCKVPKLKQEGFATIMAEWTKNGDANEKVTVRVTPEMVLQIFQRISDEDISFMGFSPIWSRPENMICQVLPVPPPAVRPSVKHDAHERSEDDLTHLLIQVLKTNKSLKDKIANATASPVSIDEEHMVLQYFVSCMIDNKMRGAQPAAQRSGRAFKSYQERLNTKQGRIRGNLMGKRVDHSARSVITPDPNVSIQELGVPLKIAKNITRPVKVTERNIDSLRQMVRNGPDEHPGAKIVEKGGAQIMLRYADRLSVARGLTYGDVVHCHMVDGDIVLFNRQPTLHRLSMMGHVVRVMPKGSTFRMNVGVTKPYNADFDGDEMNMHMPQDPEAEVELRLLAAVPSQLISPMSSVLIGVFQDSLLSAHGLTREEHRFSPSEAMEMCCNLKSFGGEGLAIFKKPWITSNELVSLVLPPMTLRTKSVLIENGRFLKGVLTKGVLSARSTGIIHRLANDFGHSVAADFIDNLQSIVTEFAKKIGFSVGIRDLAIPTEVREKIAAAYEAKERQSAALIESLVLGHFKNETGESDSVAFEDQMSAILASANDVMGSTARNSLAPNNRFVAMSSSGSKGSDINIVQMVSCLGQQQLEGGRIPYGFKDRTLPHFTKYDDGPEARGFIKSSFVQGLVPTELFFHAIAGRDGIIDTAVKTASTGYLQRRLVKALEDVKAEYDGTVRNAKGKILQFRYGGDNIDPCKVEEQHFPLCAMSVEQVYAHFNMAGVPYDETPTGATSAAQRSHAQMDECNRVCREWTLKMLEERDDIVLKVFRNSNEHTLRIPVAFAHLIISVAGSFGIGPDSKVDLTPLETFQLLDTYFAHLTGIGRNFGPGSLFKTVFYFFLSPKTLLVQHRYSRKALVALLEHVTLQYKRALINPGEMVGIIAAQSHGELSTQLTLNTFHYAGIGSKTTVTRGTPRLEEILSISPKVKNPSVTASLTDPSKEAAYKLVNFFPHTCIRDVAVAVELYYCPSDEEEDMDGEDLETVRYHREFEAMAAKAEGAVPDRTNFSPWVVRIEMDKESMFSKHITMDDVYFALRFYYEGGLGYVYSDYNADSLVFRLRLSTETAKKKVKKGIDDDDHFDKLTKFEDEILDLTLRGVSGISRAVVRSVKNKVTKVADTFKPQESFEIDTFGTNLLDVLGLPFVADATSNDIREVYSVLGIDAARECILRELAEVLETDSKINDHHKYILAERMTNNAHMCAIFRTGLNSDKDTGPLAKASFEETPEQLTKAAKFGELDIMTGVSANIMLGQTGKFGTAAFEVLLDEDALPKTIAARKRRTTELPAPGDPRGVVDVRNDLSYVISTTPEIKKADDDGYTISL
jgi:DNA-directed RNA polymerase II subunit RPB1